jgi:hypothetical protein
VHMVQVISCRNSLSWSHAVGSNYERLHPWSFRWWRVCQTAPAENYVPLISSHAAAMCSCNNGVCRRSNGNSVVEAHEADFIKASYQTSSIYHIIAAIRYARSAAPCTSTCYDWLVLCLHSGQEQWKSRALRFSPRPLVVIELRRRR